MRWNVATLGAGVRELMRSKLNICFAQTFQAFSVLHLNPCCAAIETTRDGAVWHREWAREQDVWIVFMYAK